MRKTAPALLVLLCLFFAACSAGNPLSPGTPNRTNYYTNVLTNTGYALIRVNVQHNGITPMVIQKNRVLSISTGFLSHTNSLMLNIDSTNSSSNTSYLYAPEGDYMFSITLPSESLSASSPIWLAQAMNPGDGWNYYNSSSFASFKPFSVQAGFRYTLTITPVVSTAFDLYRGFTNGSMYSSTPANVYCRYSFVKDP